MNRSEWTLLAISFAKERGLSPVQLQKSLFLLGKELPSEVGQDFYRFIRYNYGPFDRAIYSDASVLSAKGLVSIGVTENGLNEYSLTPLGLQYVDLLKPSASNRAVSYLKKTVEWAQSLSFSDLVRAIYQKYPEYRENSVFQG